jgi:hypothetical protein
MRKNDAPPGPVIAASLLGAMLGLGNTLIEPSLRETGAYLLLTALVLATTVAFGYCTANLLRSAAILANPRRDRRR